MENIPKPSGGILGKLQAYVLAVEEQNRTTLHFHVIAYIQGLNKILKQIMLLPKGEERTHLGNQLLHYIKSVLTASYGNIGVEHYKKSNSNNHQTTCHIIEESGLDTINDENFKKARHRQLCRYITGCLHKCNSCNTYLNTLNLLEKPLKHLYSKSALCNTPHNPLEKYPIPRPVVEQYAMSFS